MNATLVFQKSYDFYKNLYLNLRQIPKRDRFTWGERCETLALGLVRLSAKAEYAPKSTKRTVLSEASEALDLLKIYLRLGYDLRILDQKKCLMRQGELQEIGRMVGGWMNKI